MYDYILQCTGEHIKYIYLHILSENLILQCIAHDECLIINYS